MSEANGAADLLERLAAARLASHVFAAGDGATAASSLDDEAECIDALGMLADGPLWRVGPFRYAFRAAEGSTAGSVLDALRTALPDHAALADATIAALAAPAAVPATGHPHLAVLTAAARGALSLPGAQRVVIDAAVAETAVAQALARIDGAAAALAARLTPPDPAEDTIGPALARIESSLAALPPPIDHGADLAALRSAVDTLHAAQPTPTDPAAGLDALQVALDAAAARQEAALAALAADLSARLDRQQQALASLAERYEAASAEDRVGEIAARVADIAARPVVNVDFRQEREGMLRLSSAMQTMLGRLDAAANRLIDGAAPDAGAIESLGRRLDALTAALVAEDGAAPEAETAALDAALARLEAAAAALAATAAQDGETLRSLAARMDTVVAALPAPQAEAPDTATGLQAMVEEGLARLREALASRDGEAQALVGAAERIGAACAELHGLHQRYLDATPLAAPAAASAPRPVPAPPQPDAFPPEIDADLDAFEADRTGEASAASARASA